jgi:aryl-alcohol dehydrogenase-like predicted oxidoreductase
MNTKQLGNSDLYITPIGLGAWAIGGSDWAFGWGAQDDRDSIDARVRHIGVSNFDVGQLRRAQAIAPLTSLQPPYSLVNRQVEDEILPFAAREKLGVIAYSPMASGLLTGAMTRARLASLPADDWRQTGGTPYGLNFREPLLSRNLRLVALRRAIGRRRGRSPGCRLPGC